MSRSISNLGGMRCSKSNSRWDELWTLLAASRLACLKRPKHTQDMVMSISTVCLVTKTLEVFTIYYISATRSTVQVSDLLSTAPPMLLELLSRSECLWCLRLEELLPLPLMPAPLRLALSSSRRLDLEDLPR